MNQPTNKKVKRKEDIVMSAFDFDDNDNYINVERHFDKTKYWYKSLLRG